MNMDIEARVKKVLPPVLLLMLIVSMVRPIWLMIFMLTRWI